MIEKPVTVAELIQLLQGMPLDMPVLVDGYESGYVAPEVPCVRNMRANVNKQWYYGPHETADSEEPTDFEAVLLCRSENHLSHD